MVSAISPWEIWSAAGLKGVKGGSSGYLFLDTICQRYLIFTSEILNIRYVPPMSFV